jgi:hypothetical protein
MFQGNIDYLHISIPLNTTFLTGDVLTELKATLTKYDVLIRYLGIENSTLVMNITVLNNGLYVQSSDLDPYYFALRNAAEKVVANNLESVSVTLLLPQKAVFDAVHFNYPSSGYLAVLAMTIISTLLIGIAVGLACYLRQRFTKETGSWTLHFGILFAYLLYLIQVIIAYSSPLSNVLCVSQMLLSWISSSFLVG